MRTTDSHYGCHRRVVFFLRPLRVSYDNKQRLALDVSRCPIYLLQTRRIKAYCIRHTCKRSNNWIVFINHNNVSFLFKYDRHLFYHTILTHDKNIIYDNVILNNSSYKIWIQPIRTQLKLKRSRKQKKL